MIGAIIGDIVGSRFEFDFNNIKTKEFDFFHEDCEWTDDSLMTVAVAAAIMKWRDEGGDLRQAATESMRTFAQANPCGYGSRFRDWLGADNPKPYNSWGNGSAMRVSACGWIGTSLDEVKSLSLQVTDITHNHPEGIKGAEATAVAIWLARQGWKISEIRAHVVANYYPMDFTLDAIRPTYHMDESCQGSVPQALEAFFESTSFEDAIRNAISIGGDSDTIGAICGAVAGAYYGVPADIRVKAESFLDPFLVETLKKFERSLEML
jgi:type I restriction enzyme M protein